VEAGSYCQWNLAVDYTEPIILLFERYDVGDAYNDYDIITITREGEEAIKIFPAGLKFFNIFNIPPLIVLEPLPGNTPYTLTVEYTSDFQEVSGWKMLITNLANLVNCVPLEVQRDLPHPTHLPTHLPHTHTHILVLFLLHVCFFLSIYCIGVTSVPCPSTPIHSHLHVTPVRQMFVDESNSGIVDFAAPGVNYRVLPGNLISVDIANGTYVGQDRLYLFRTRNEDGLTHFLTQTWTDLVPGTAGGAIEVYQTGMSRVLNELTMDPNANGTCEHTHTHTHTCPQQFSLSRRISNVEAGA